MKGRTESIMSAPIQRLLSEYPPPPGAISLGQGVPFFPPPDEAVEELRNFKEWSYTEDAGLEELREAIVEKVRRFNSIKTSKENITVTSGANMAFVNAIMAITNIGDEVILLRPYYFNHEMALKLSGVRPVVVDTDDNFMPDVEKIREKITSRTRAIVLVSPNNPTGAVYPEDTIKAICETAEENDIFIISDEPYEFFVFEGAKHFSPASYYNNTISLFSFSKSYGIPGLRVGYMIYPESLGDDILKVQDTITICPPTPSQKVALRILRCCPDYPMRYLGDMEKIRKMFISKLSELDRIDFVHTKGAFYFMIRVHASIDGRTLAARLITEHGIITIPGEVFGLPGPYLRLSYGNLSPEKAEVGLSRLVKALTSFL